MAKNDFTNFSQGYDIEILDLFQQKEFYSYEYMSDFEKHKEQLWNKENFIVHWLVKKKIAIHIINMLVKFGINLIWKQWKMVTTNT